MATPTPAASTPVGATPSTPVAQSPSGTTTPTTAASTPAATTPTTPAPSPTQSTPTTTPLSTPLSLTSTTLSTPVSASISTPSATSTPSASHTSTPSPPPTHTYPPAPPVPLPTSPPPRLPVSTAVIASLSAVVFVIVLAIVYRFFRSCRAKRNKAPLPPPRPLDPPQYPYPPLRPPSTLFANEYERKSFYESGSFASLVASQPPQQRYSMSNSMGGGVRRSSNRGSWTPSGRSAGDSSTELTELEEPQPGAPDPAEAEQSDPGPPLSSSAHTDEPPVPDSPRSPDPLLAPHAYIADSFTEPVVAPSPSTSPKPLSSHPSRTSIHSTSTSTGPARSSSGSSPHPPGPMPRPSRHGTEQSHTYTPSVASSHTRTSIYSAHTLHPSQAPPMPLPYRGAPHAPHMRARIETVMPEPLSRAQSPYEQFPGPGSRHASMYGQVRASVYGGMGMGGPPMPPPGWGSPAGWERGRSPYPVPPAGYDEREAARQRHRSTPMPPPAPPYASRPSSVASAASAGFSAPRTPRKPSRLTEAGPRRSQDVYGTPPESPGSPPPVPVPVPRVREEEEEEKEVPAGLGLPALPHVGEVEG